MRQEGLGETERSWRKKQKRRQMGRWREELQNPAAGDGTYCPHALAATAGWSPRAAPGVLVAPTTLSQPCKSPGGVPRGGDAPPP